LAGRVWLGGFVWAVLVRMFDRGVGVHACCAIGHACGA